MSPLVKLKAFQKIPSGTSTVGTRAIDPLIQTMHLDIRKELWEVVDSTAVFPNLSGPSIDLSGDWVGKNYRCSSRRPAWD